MNKKLVAVAIAGLLAAPLAQAQTANVTLYGRLNMDMEVVNGKQLAAVQPGTCTPAVNAVNTCLTTNPNQFRVSSNSSRFGIRGTESLGGGLNAIFQVENAVQADNGATAASSRVIGNRDTFVGLQGSWGTFKMGYYHLPYDNIGSIWGDNPTLETSILNQGVWAQSFSSKGEGSFDDRVGNSIRWDSPVMSGWQGQFSYSIGGGNPPNEGKPQTNSSTSSGILLYNNGPIQFGAGFQYNNAVRVAGLSDIAYSFAASYQFPKVRIGAIYERLDYDCAAGVADATKACQTKPGVLGTGSLTRNFYGVDVTLNAGPGLVYARWSFAGDGAGSAPDNSRVAGLAHGDNSSSNQWQLSYAYPLSKRTSLFAGYAAVLNKSNASYNFGVNSYGTAIGGKPQGFAMGMWHNF